MVSGLQQPNQLSGPPARLTLYGPVPGPLLENIVCDIVLTVTRALAVGALLAVVPCAAEPSAVSGAAESYAREYRIREDASTGRLVRQAVKVRRSTRTRNESLPLAGQENTVVQGESGRPASSEAGRLDLESLIRQMARRFEVDPGLVRAVIRQESAYDPYAVSVKGAKGLMQLMPATARRLGVKDVFDPAENVRGGTELLRTLLDRYDGDRRLALAAYNAGEAAVERYDGVPPYRETEDYVERIVGGDPGATAHEGEFVERVGPRRVIAMVEPSGALLFVAE